MANIHEISASQWGLVELEKDNLYSYIPSSRRMEYVEDAISAGQEMAESFGNAELEPLFESANIRIKEIENTTTHENPEYRLQARLIYRQNCGEVELFMSELKKKCSAVNEYISDNKLDIQEISLRKMREVHLAHEFLHLQEFEKDRRIGDDLPPVYVKKLFIKRKESILRTSEIAAQEFAYQFSKIKLRPEAMDAILLQYEKREDKNHEDSGI